MVLEESKTSECGCGARIGVFGIGLKAYWPQFPGLKERLEGYQGVVEKRIRNFGCRVVSAGLIDTPEGGRRAGRLFAREDFDLLVCHAATYATSSQVLPVVRKSGLPVLVLNLQPVAALDYENTGTGEWLANPHFSSADEQSTRQARHYFVALARRARRTFKYTSARQAARASY